MKTKVALAVLAALIMGFAGGCKTTATSENTEGAQPATKEKTAKTEKARKGLPGGIIGTIPADSPFAKLKIGMPMAQVYDLIGAPTDSKSYVTGKSWIPYYYGSDTARIEARYKGQGAITFTGGGGWGSGVYKVFRVVYDAKEEGYVK